MLLSTNRALTIPTTGEQLPYETMNVGRCGAWDEWNVVQATERLKTGHEAYVEALRDVLVPPSEP